MPKIISVDFDGCLTGIDAESNYKIKLEEFVAGIAEKPDILLSGSIRYSLLLDLDNAFSPPKTSSFPKYRKLHQLLCEKFNVEADQLKFSYFLLQDLFTKVPQQEVLVEHGSILKTFFDCFQDQDTVTALDYLREMSANPDFAYYTSLEHTKFRDKNKILLLLAQIFKFSAEFAMTAEPITFEFFDDKLDILNTLKSFFTANHVPKNVFLKLTHCIHGEIQPTIFEIQGTAAVDLDWQKTINVIVNKTTSLNKMISVDIVKETLAQQQKLIHEAQFKPAMIKISDNSAGFFTTATAKVAPQESQTAQIKY